MEPMGKKQIMKPAPEPISPSDPRVLAKTHVPVEVNNKTYQELQKKYFGTVMAKKNSEAIKCADVPLDTYSKTSSIEQCRIIADGDMEVSASEIFAYAVKETGFLAQKRWAPIDVLSKRLTGNGSYEVHFDESFGGCNAARYISTTTNVLVSLAALDSVMKAAGVEMNAPVSGEIHHTPTCMDFDISGDVNAVKADNKAFRTFWNATGSTSLPIQNVFNVLQKQFLDYLNANQQPEAEQVEASKPKRSSLFRIIITADALQ